MSTRCFQSVQGLCLRITRLDTCCNPPSGGTADSFVVSNSFIDLSLTAELEEPDEFIVKTASGKLCLNEIGCATLKRYTVQVNLCNADPDLFNIIGGVNRVLDSDGDVIGYQVDQGLGDCTAKFSLEIWTRIPQDSCTTADTEYLYWLLPCVQNGRVGDITIENGPLTFSFTADALPSSVWASGPYNVMSNPTGSPVVGQLVTPVTCQVALHVQTTTVAPPCITAASCATPATADNCGSETMTTAGVPTDIEAVTLP